MSQWAHTQRKEANTQCAAVNLQIGFRWDGEGVNIAVAIELFAGGDAARMVPKVTDLQMSGVIRVLLAPLCPEIPCFGAAVVALRCALCSAVICRMINGG